MSDEIFYYHYLNVNTDIHNLFENHSVTKLGTFKHGINSKLNLN